MTETITKQQIAASIFQAPLHRAQARVMLVQQELNQMGIRYYQRFLRETCPEYSSPEALKDVYTVMNHRTTNVELVERVVKDLEKMIENLKAE